MNATVLRTFIAEIHHGTIDLPTSNHARSSVPLLVCMGMTEKVFLGYCKDFEFLVGTVTGSFADRMDMIFLVNLFVLVPSFELDDQDDKYQAE